MRNRLAFLVVSLFFCCCRLAWAQPVTSETEQLFSPSTAQKFYEIAYELANPAADTTTSPSIGANQPQPDVNAAARIEQAIIFSNAALDLDSRASYIPPLIFRLASQYTGKYDLSQVVYVSLDKYLDKSADFEPARQAVAYLLERLNAREQREQLLTTLSQNLTGRSPCFDSELATLLGLLSAEKADANTAQYFMLAYNNNKYNKLAFEKLAEFMDIPPAIHLEHLRLMLGENPLDLESALAFARSAERFALYEVAADAYEYCGSLFAYLYPSQELPAYIYLPLMMSNYNTRRNQDACLQIASRIRQQGRFDILAEAVAAKAAVKIGDTEQAKKIYRAVEEKINTQPSDINTQSIAWFYCFASPDANKALDWANRAYSVGPNSPAAASILAYSLVLNGQKDWAKPLIEKHPRNQISDLALAQIQLADANKDAAIGTLKSAIARDPGSLEAELAKQILASIGGEYVPPVDSDAIISALRNTFAENVVPVFTNPEKIISAQLNFRGIEFPYGSTLDASVTIMNNSYEPLVISDDGLFTGHIRVDAVLTGDINEIIPDLASFKIRPASPIDAGSSFLVPLHLFTGRLRQLLITHPQASVNMEFTLYLDPVITDTGQTAGRIPGLKPSVVSVKRPGVEITERFLQNRLSSLARGQQGQKIKTAQLFTGLLMEQYALANRKSVFASAAPDKLAYKLAAEDWMIPLLKSALLHHLVHEEDWTAKAHALADMTDLPLDYEFVNALSGNLNDTHWPVRLITMYLLARSQGDSFTKVLDWTAKYDSNNYVRIMAVSLGGAPPPPPPQVQEQQTQQQSQQKQSAPPRR
jgi:hypothetical protein